MKVLILSTCLWGLLVMAAGGCGGVGVERSGADPLRVLAISPRMGETGVPSDSDVVVVFSAGVTLGPSSDAGELNADTFRVLGSGATRVAGEPSISTLDLDTAETVVFHPSAPLGAGGYEMVLSASLVGQTDDGPTEPLGVEIRSTFEVGP